MIWVVGAVAIDLIAMRDRFLDGTSNPSDIRLGLGGVGYRVFSNLDTPRRFITALAADPLSAWARKALESEEGVLIQAVEDRDAGPPLYLALMESGSLKVAASDFRIVEQQLSEDFVVRALQAGSPRDFLVLDANLSPSLLAGLAGRFRSDRRVIVEPVSVEKARRHDPALHDLFLLTPTEEEVDALCPDPASFRRERRIQHLLVTRGRQGAILYDAAGVREFPPNEVVETEDTTGAGDLLLAG
ncbi:MAG TPA: PfkB family carbohydrate kinase, partial [Spirochaetia bacterium]|nr:PfkB family carbohydrate kinase [Spirochaetia bacterium]